MQSEQEEIQEATLGHVKKEMAMPRMAQSAQHAISQLNWRPNQPMKSNIEALPKISFDLGGVVILSRRYC
jgi:hypothetical protein